MRYTHSFLKTLKDAPKEAELISHQYLLRGGFVTPLGAGIYTYLPMGFRVMRKIYTIIQEELNKIGVEDILMPVVHPARVWKETGRFFEVGPELWKIQNRSEEDFVLAMTHEEVVTDAAKKVIQSYKDLPKLVGQIQLKVRDEARPRGGLLRLREFTMQDAYSFDKDEKELEMSYQKFIGAYKKIFERVGVKTVMIESDTGAMGGLGAHEFMMITPSGEDKIVTDGTRAVNAEKLGIAKEEDVDSPAAASKIAEFFGTAKVEFMRGIEVGNIFKLGTKYSDPQKLNYLDENNQQRPVIMGSYGIGLDRLIASIVEASHDDKGMIWPKAVAPYHIHLISIGDDEKVWNTANHIYEELWQAGAEVFFDDRLDVSAGDKFADADLIGIPLRVVISSKTLNDSSVEVKEREKKTARLVALNSLVDSVRPR
ncbi:TPA: proline--tRNA ligase [Patescibacteria group bacterium]|uniref:Proline--tRNA ligase n=2 Tax=Bacteria division Kazan-3B-28 TaxID=1798534 RepID=A0A0G1X6H9_UNCK3|nr:MAG: prolyl-tRNA synthetase, prolyl-tRNA synthetase [candidate division Kazan bacterium GW2011_GWA1_50_15]KKW25936.1 MAG: Proline-tRNA ligase-like protein [candidate division Kazan bacterium GW2011_GWC1_52_13]KKW26591.1 MAG: Proline-tRNA ligase-like protein [candidate division Kazan bacterium GW2011_GWB1_52_7]HAV65689.1 proline--tRNA ligase [Patescibacteria group bacterium]HCL47416.1 proline--tRNA ligase [Patescibacteria group bacterium]